MTHTRAQYTTQDGPTDRGTGHLMICTDHPILTTKRVRTFFINVSVKVVKKEIV